MAHSKPDDSPWPRAASGCGTKVESIFTHPAFATDPNAVYIGMPCRYTAAHPEVVVGPFGKPWACLNDPRGWKAGYRDYLRARLREDLAFREAVAGLHGKTLVCFCKGKRGIADKDCHGDLLAVAVEYLAHR